MGAAEENIFELTEVDNLVNDYSLMLVFSNLYFLQIV